MKRTSNRRIAASFLLIASTVASRFESDATNLSTYATNADLGVFGTIGVVGLGLVGVLAAISAYGRYQTTLSELRAARNERDAAEDQLHAAWDTEAVLRYDLREAQDRVHLLEGKLVRSEGL